MVYELLCKMSGKFLRKKYLDVYAGKPAGMGCGRMERKGFIVVPMELTEEQFKLVDQEIDGKPRFQIGLKSIQKKKDISKRKIKNRKKDYQPLLEG